MPAKTRNNKPAKADQAAMCGAFPEGGRPEDKRISSLLDGKCSPQEHYKQVRLWRKQWFIAAILGLRQVLFHHGFALRAADPKQQGKVDDWLKETTNRKNLAFYVRDLWAEWLANDAAISFWMNGAVRPTLLNLEEIEYRDEFGQELLIITHGLSDARIDEMDLPADVRAKLKREKKIKIKPDDEMFHFEALKREQVGRGIGVPVMTGVFGALSASDSLESHDAVLANLMRRVYEQHKIGHETRYGPNAGGASNFIKKSRQDAVVNGTKGKTGHVQLTSNFDHEIVYPGVEAKRFDAARYDGIIKRLNWWAMPLGQLLTAQGQQPQLMGLLETQAIEERKQIALHLQLVGEAFNFPTQITATWSDDCFRDERIFSELLKLGLSAGPVSQTSFLQALNLDPEQEREFKTAEAKLPKEQTMPIFDAAHGINPAKSGGVNGRPAGAADKFARNGEAGNHLTPALSPSGEGEDTATAI